MIQDKPEIRFSGTVFTRCIVSLAAVLQIAALTSCGGRILKDDVKRCDKISVVSYTSNSWYHWGDGDPAMSDMAMVMAFDTISIVADQSLFLKVPLEEIDDGIRKGKLIPGKIASNYGVSEIKKMFNSSGIRFDVKQGETVQSKDNHSYGAVTSEILNALEAVVPPEYAVYISSAKDYMQFLDPYGRSNADGMKLLHIPDITPESIKSSAGVDGASEDTYYMVINADYSKRGYTVFGSGSAEINCLMQAVIYNSKGEPVWKTEVEGTGSKFAVMQYFIFSWKSTENSVRSATSEALGRLVHQLKKDLKHITVRQER